MSTRNVQRTIRVCDICEREEKSLDTCMTCGLDMCLLCHVSAMPGCFVRPEICKKCAERDDVKDVVRLHGERIGLIVSERNAALLRLPHEVKK